MTYFNNVCTLEELRKQYKELLKTHHPDNGGNVAQMQEVNAEYDALFKQLKDSHDGNSTDRDKASYDNMKYDFTEDAKLREMLWDSSSRLKRRPGTGTAKHSGRKAIRR